MTFIDDLFPIIFLSFHFTTLLYNPFLFLLPSFSSRQWFSIWFNIRTAFAATAPYCKLVIVIMDHDLSKIKAQNHYVSNNPFYFTCYTTFTIIFSNKKACQKLTLLRGTASILFSCVFMLYDMKPSCEII